MVASTRAYIPRQQLQSVPLTVTVFELLFVLAVD